MANKSCPVTRKHFREKAKPITLQIGTMQLVAPVKEFSTGSLGWYLNGKMTVDLAGTIVEVQIGLNLTIVGSKELPHDAPQPSPTP
jgi:hypothetical protein